MPYKRLKGSSFKPSLISFTSAVVILYSRVGWRCDGVSNKSFHLCKQKRLPLKSLFYFNFNTDKFLIDLSNLSEDFHEPTRSKSWRQETSFGRSGLSDSFSF